MNEFKKSGIDAAWDKVELEYTRRDAEEENLARDMMAEAEIMNEDRDVWIAYGENYARSILMEEADSTRRLNNRQLIMEVDGVIVSRESKMKDLNGLDGLERDIAKLTNAWKRRGKSAKIIAAYTRPRSFHNTTNICVETCRDANYEDASYLGGHILMVSLCVNVLAIAGLIGLTLLAVG